MAITETSKTTEFSTGVSGSLAMHSDSSTGYLYSPAVLVPSEVGGLTKYTNRAFTNSATNGTNVKASAGKLYKLEVCWNATSPVWLRIFDDSDAPTASDTPVLVYPIECAGTDRTWFQFDYGPIGLTFSSGIGYRISAATGDSDATYTAPIDAVASSAFIVNMFYK